MRNTRSLTRCSSIAWRTTIAGASLSYKNTVGGKGPSMKRCPGSGSEFREALDGEIREPREGRRQIVAHREFQPAAAFHDRENRRNLRSRRWAANVYPVLPVMYTCT